MLYDKMRLVDEVDRDVFVVHNQQTVLMAECSLRCVAYSGTEKRKLLNLWECDRWSPWLAFMALH